jgi:hypothetical protein
MSVGPKSQLPLPDRKLMQQVHARACAQFRTMIGEVK